jgi:uncharacterized membrane protein
VLFSTSIEIHAPQAQVWATLADVERWPEWTASMKQVDLVSGRPLALGSRVRVKQPRLQALEWKVTELVPGEVFTWTGSTLGVQCVGRHCVEPKTTDSVTVTLSLEQTGFLAPVIGRVMARLTRRYIDMEARGCKARSEAGVRSSGE